MRMILDRNSKLLGCDISKWQGKVDFFKMKKAGIQFVILRAGCGTSIDKNFKSYIDGAKKAGLHIGVYWFLYASNIATSIDNATFCLQVIEPYMQIIDMGVWADWEYDSDTKVGAVLSNTTRSAMVRAFLKKVSDSGYFVGIYANKDYIARPLFTAELIAEYPLWYARYSEKIDISGTKGADGYPYIWQYTSKGKGKDYGVSSDDLDLDYAFVKFVDDKTKPSGGITVNKFVPKKGAKVDWVNIISNLKRALNVTFGLNLPINGIIDETLLIHLGNVLMGENCPLTDMNYVLQQIFIWWGYSNVKADGIFGPVTANTIATFQQQTGLVQTKTTTKEFWRKLLGK